MKKWISALALFAMPFMASADEAPAQEIEKTFTMIKPDALSQDHIHDILGFYAQKGLRIIQTKRMQLTREEAEQFYAAHKEQPFFEQLITFITSGPVLAVELEGPNAVAITREVMGDKDPSIAGEGTIRHTFGESITCNAVHGSDSHESAVRELSFFFGQ